MNEVLQPCEFEGSPYVLIAKVSERVEVVANLTNEELRFLRDNRKLRPKVFNANGGDVEVVDYDLPRGLRPEAIECTYEPRERRKNWGKEARAEGVRGFPRASATHNANLLPRFNL